MNGNQSTKTTDTPNDPLVLHIDAIIFEPEIHLERRKLTVDFEITLEQQKQIVEYFYARNKTSTRGPVRMRFVGRPV